MTQQIFILGSLAFDHIMVLPGKFSDWIMPDKIHKLNVSFTVESLRKEFGGTGGNCAYTLGLLGLEPSLLGVIGKDGLEYRDHLKKVGVNVDGVLIDAEYYTATGNVMTDMDDNQLWSFYPGPLGRMKDISLKNVVQENDIVVLLPSEPSSFLKHLHEVVKLGTQYLFDPAFFIPNFSKEDLLLGIKNAAIIIGNDYEIALMEQKTNSNVRQWIRNSPTIVVKTLGVQGSEIYQGTNVIRIPAARVEKVTDPTGAGDAYRAGFLAGFIKDFDLESCGRMGAVAAAYSVELYGTQTHGFTPEHFNKRLKRAFTDG